MKQFVIIGIGNFGYYLSTQLYEKGHEVIAIDINADLIQSTKDSVSQAIVADATNLQVLKSLGIDRADAVVVCIGSNLSSSILATLNVKDIGIKKILAKAINEPHARILNKIGASEVFSPEKDLAISMAERMHNPNIIDYLPFVENHSIVQISSPNGFINKSLKELNLINEFNIQVLAIKDYLTNRINVVPKGEHIIKKNDELILLGANNDLDKLRESRKRK